MMLDAAIIELHRRPRLCSVELRRRSTLQSHGDRDNLLAFIDRRA